MKSVDNATPKCKFVLGVLLLFCYYFLFWVSYYLSIIYYFSGVSALILSAFVLGHIYLGTIGNEGSFEGMIKGEVDEAWAKQHHDLWYNEVKGKNS